MEEKYILEKEYTINSEDFKEGYLAYQKKFVYTKSYIFMTLFLVIAAVYIVAAAKDPSNTLAYVLVFISLALGFREWYNPRKMRRLFVDTFNEIGELKNKICVGEDYAEFSTIQDDDVENSGVEEELPEEISIVEPTRIEKNDSIKLIEYERFILFCVGKETFYIIPTAEWGKDEINVLKSVFSGDK